MVGVSSNFRSIFIQASSAGGDNASEITDQLTNAKVITGTL
jgi:hypothetical protein